MIRIGILLLLILPLLTLASACGSSPDQTITPTPTSIPTPTPQQTTTPTYPPLSSLPSIANVVEKVMPSVVYISVEYLDTSSFFQTIRTKTGSGVILSPEGYILTNNHVVEDARNIDILLPDNNEIYQAELVGTDPLADLAVIKIDGQNFPFISFADTSTLRIGDWVIAVGNALGLEGGSSVTLGIVSNLERSIPLDESVFYDIIQTDAAINPGNSGGPLVDLEGKVVGINTLIFTSAQNIGFAVNASTAQRAYADLIRLGRVARPWLGVSLQTVTPALATELDLSQHSGVRISYVEPDSPSDREGLRINDVITHLQDHEVTEATRLIKLVWEYGVGEQIKITFWRDKQQHEVWVTLGERPA